jgi:hypothetical protein
VKMLSTRGDSSESAKILVSRHTLLHLKVHCRHTAKIAKKHCRTCVALMIMMKLRCRQLSHEERGSSLFIVQISSWSTYKQDHVGKSYWTSNSTDFIVLHIQKEPLRKELLDFKVCMPISAT